MTATVTHQPKAGATLTGTEYEAADHHVVSITPADIGAAADDHDHDGTYATSGHTHDTYALAAHDHDADYEAAGAVAAHEAAVDPHPGYLTAAEGDAAYAASDHTHGASGLTHPQVLARGLGA